MSDHRHHDPRPGTSLTHTREDSGIKPSQPLATSTPRSSPRKGEECRRQKEESCHDNKVRKNNYPHSSPSKTSLRLEEEMKRELGLWNNNNNKSRCTITGTKRRQWKLPATDQQKPEEETMPTNTIPRSLTTTWTNPRTIPRTEAYSMGTSSNRFTAETNMQQQHLQAASSISRNCNQRMPTWITMASSNTNRNTMSREITSTNQNLNTSINRIREGSNDHLQTFPSYPQHHPQQQQHNSLSRAIRLHNNRLDNSHQGPRHQLSNEDQCAQPQELLNQPESFLSLELQPLPPPPPCRTGSKEQQLHLHISISSPSLFEESFSSQDSCINTTAQPARLGPF